MKIKQSLAFTLAEALITLGIIGLVASMTIPALIANYNKYVFVIQLKKDYSTWNEALKQMAADSGCPGDLSCFFTSDDRSAMGSKIAKYFKTVKVCPSSIADYSACNEMMMSGDFEGGMACMQTAEETAKGNGVLGCFSEYKRDLNSNNPVPEDSGSFRFVTADGMSFSMTSAFKDCNQSSTEDGQPSSEIRNLNKICSQEVLIDVNGNKPPNILGRDVFSFYITTGKGPALFPAMGSKELYYWKTSSIPEFMCRYEREAASPGSACAARIIDEGWEMNY